MRKLIFVVISVILSIGTTQADDNDLQVVAQAVLNKMYLVNGNHVYLKPSIVVTNDSHNAALYLRRNNKIEISEKVFRVCREFGKDSLSALAYIIGHELAHAYQTDYNVHETSFLAYDHKHDSSSSFEEAADVTGVFLTYLAGYNSMSILSEVISKIYMEFELSNELDGYPTLDERMATAEKVRSMTTTLVRIFEGANYLVSIGKYELAAESYSYIEQHFQGKEIYNNIGLCKVLQAMDIKEQNIFPYVFPFELEWETRMSRPVASRGVDQLSAEERILYDSYLAEAQKYFDLASKMDPTEIGAEINTLCTMIMQFKAKEAIAYAKKHDLELRAYLKSDGIDYINRYRSAMAIAYNESGDIGRAQELWSTIISESIGVLVEQAKYNSSTKELKVEAEQYCNCPEIEVSEASIDKVRLHRPTPRGPWVIINDQKNISLSIDENPQSLVYTYVTEQGYFSIQRTALVDLVKVKGNPKPTKNLLTDSGYISSCDDLRVALRFGKNDKLVEWIKFY